MEVNNKNYIQFVSDKGLIKGFLEQNLLFKVLLI